MIYQQKRGEKDIKAKLHFTPIHITPQNITPLPANRKSHSWSPPAENPRQQQQPTDSRRAISVANKTFKAILVFHSRSISEKVKTVKACSPYPLRSPGIPLGQSSRHLFHLVEYFPDAIEHLRQSLRVHARGLLTVTALFVQC